MAGVEATRPAVGTRFPTRSFRIRTAVRAASLSDEGRVRLDRLGLRQTTDSIRVDWELP